MGQSVTARNKHVSLISVLYDSRAHEVHTWSNVTVEGGGGGGEVQLTTDAVKNKLVMWYDWTSFSSEYFGRPHSHITPYHHFLASHESPSTTIFVSENIANEEMSYALLRKECDMEGEGIPEEILPLRIDAQRQLYL